MPIPEDARLGAGRLGAFQLGGTAGVLAPAPAQPNVTRPLIVVLAGRSTVLRSRPVAGAVAPPRPLRPVASRPTTVRLANRSTTLRTRPIASVAPSRPLRPVASRSITVILGGHSIVLHALGVFLPPPPPPVSTLPPLKTPLTARADPSATTARVTPSATTAALF